MEVFDPIESDAETPDEDWEDSCLARAECVAPLLASAPPGRFYCMAEELLGEEDGWD